MASQIVEFEPINTGKGCTLRFFEDHSKPEGDVDRCWMEASYDGKPDSELFDIRAHWHKDHDEVMEMKSGRMKFTVEGVEHIITPESGRLLIPRRHVHSGISFAGEPAVAIEKTVPNGDLKALFFADLFQEGKPPGFLLAMRSYYEGDGYVPLPGNMRWLDEVFVKIVGFIATFFAPKKPSSLKRKAVE